MPQAIRSFRSVYICSVQYEQVLSFANDARFSERLAMLTNRTFGQTKVEMQCRVLRAAGVNNVGNLSSHKDHVLSTADVL
jgi:predicted oxidoreductase